MIGKGQLRQRWFQCGLLVVLAVALAVPFLSRHPMGTPSGGHTDHASHVGAARVAPLVGLDLWRRPIGDFFPTLTGSQIDSLPADIRRALLDYPGNAYAVPSWPSDRPLYMNYSPRAYPPGVLALALPSAISYQLGLLSFSASNRLMIVLFVLGWYAATRIWLSSAKADDIPTPERGLLLLAGSGYTLYWAIEGMYDACFVALGAAAFEALRLRRVATSALLFGLAATLHLRAFAFFPVVALCLERPGPSGAGERSRSDTARVAFALSLLAIPVAFAAIARPALAALPLNNPVSYLRLGSVGPWAFAACAVALAIGYARSAAYVDLIFLAAGAAVLMGAREVRAWHVLAVCPWLLGPSWVTEPMSRRVLRLRVASAVVFFAACNWYSLAGARTPPLPFPV